MIDKNRLLQLLTKFHANKESRSEHDELLKWYENQEGKPYSIAEEEQVRNGAKERLIQSISARPTKRFPYPLVWIPVAAAMLIVGFIGFRYIFSNTEKVASMEELSQIKPAKEHAIMTLENGKEINLDQLALNEEIQVDNLIIKKDENGKVSYFLANTNEPINQMNSIHVPIAATFPITLSDGTRVLLNSDSKLSFPSTFDAKERIVELEGEGYFEVAHLSNNSRFIVKTADQTIEVLGTKFNIKGYKSEETTQTSLKEGSVKVSDNYGKQLLLKPNQQAKSIGSNPLTLTNVNMDQVLGWTNGEFFFDGNNTNEVLREIARWYNIDIENKIASHAPNQYVGAIPRNLTLNRLVELLNYAGLKSTATIMNNQRIKLQIY
ncbi:FecR domain-containing protein [Sphingobacterium kyonggiense]